PAEVREVFFTGKFPSIACHKSKPAYPSSYRSAAPHMQEIEMPRDNDALSLLKKDHEDVKKLFKEIEAEEDQEAIFQSDQRSPRGPRRDRRGDFLPSGQ